MINQIKDQKNDSKIILFNENTIRRIWNKNNSDWNYSVVDVVKILSGSSQPRKYWNDLKKKIYLEGSELSDSIGQLKLKSSDGKFYSTDVLDTKGILRLIQSVPSKKAEPFKLWLAKLGDERINESIDPEIAIDRAVESYHNLGYSTEWINQRIKTIEVRKELTDEWDKRGVQKGQEYAILTNEITKGWSDLSTKEYKNLKNLKKENLRDNMTNLELVLNMLAEASTTEISKSKNPDSFDKNLKVAKQGGEVAKSARIKLEETTGEKVISNKNSNSLLK
jgi:hypothetical protein